MNLRYIIGLWWKQANSLLQLALKLRVTKRAVQRHAFLCVASDLYKKDVLQIRKQGVSDAVTSQAESHGDITARG